MFGQGNFRPLMGELRLAQSPVVVPVPEPAPAAAAPASAPAPAPMPVVARPADVGMSHGTQVLLAGVAVGIVLLGSIFLTD